MQHVVLVIHLILTVALIAVVLLQRSEGAGLAGPSASGMMPIRGTANILTRITAIIAGGFMITSLTLAILAGMQPKQMTLAETIAAEEQQQELQSGEGKIAPAGEISVPVSGEDDTINAPASVPPVSGAEPASPTGSAPPSSEETTPAQNAPEAAPNGNNPQN